VSVDSATQITCTGTPAKSAGTKTNGVVVTSLAGLTASIDVEYSAVPAWQTAADLGDEFDETTISTITVAATDATSYALKSGSSLPSSLSLSSGGAITGNLSGNNNADYNFYIVATDAQNQTSERQFTLGVGDYPTGGTITTYSGYRVHSFTSVGNSTFTLYATISCDILVVGGGGGGQGAYQSPGGGGGGGGGILYNSTANNTDSNASVSLASGAYTITVGTGGTKGYSDHGRDNEFIEALQGGNSSVTKSGFSSMVAIGGGYGGGYGNNDAGDGGSGGGEGFGCGRGEGTSGQGNSGGSASASASQSAAGGGGAGATGGDGDGGGGGAGGDGGVGKAYSITGSSVYYSGGGGGGAGYQGSTGGAGGNGGGAAGAATASSGNTNAPAISRQNSGGGGGGAGGPTGSIDQSPFYGSDGAHGIVVIRYAI
jgi:hypothetical protein